MKVARESFDSRLQSNANGILEIVAERTCCTKEEMQMQLNKRYIHTLFILG